LNPHQIRFAVVVVGLSLQFQHRLVGTKKLKKIKKKISERKEEKSEETSEQFQVNNPN